MTNRNGLDRSRRKAIKYIGGSLISAGTLPQIVSANNGARYEGIAYDPNSHEIIGDASAQFNDRKRGLVGNLRVNGRNYNMNQNHPDEVDEKDGEIYKNYRQVNRVENKSYNELVEISGFESSNITGFTRSPNSLDRVGFVLTNDDTTDLKHVISTLQSTKGDKNE